MIIRRLILVECIRRKVQDTVVETFVAKDDLIRLRHLLRCIAHALLYEHAVVEVALVYLPHIDEAEEGDAAHGELRIELLLIEQKQNDRADSHDDERAEGV